MRGLSSLPSATPRLPLSPYLRPLPAPPVDAEVVDLQTQVNAWLHYNITTMSCTATTQSACLHLVMTAHVKHS